MRAAGQAGTAVPKLEMLYQMLRLRDLNGAANP
jgi:hypothetical protein